MKYRKLKCKLQRFIGMMNYDRDFIANISEMLKPFYMLLRQGEKFVWTELENKLFSNLKNLWSKELSLRIPDTTKEFTLETNVSNIAIGAVLKQDSQPVVFISPTLNKAAQNYGITEKEALAIVWATEKLQYFLLGKSYKVLTDHKALEFLRSKSDFGSAKFQGWIEKLESFNYTIVYKPANEMCMADALSRAPAKCKNMIAGCMGENVLNIHKKLNHRRSIMHDLRKRGIYVSKNELLKLDSM